MMMMMVIKWTRGEGGVNFGWYFEDVLYGWAQSSCRCTVKLCTKQSPWNYSAWVIIIRMLPTPVCPHHSHSVTFKSLPATEII